MKAAYRVELIVMVGLCCLVGCHDGAANEDRVPVGKEQAQVEQLGPFQSLARFLPAAAPARLEGMSICLDSEGCQRAGRLVPGGQLWLRKLLDKLGFTSLAQASYRYGKKPGQWLLVMAASGRSTGPGLPEVLAQLQQRQVPVSRIRPLKRQEKAPEDQQAQTAAADVMELLAWAGKDAPRLDHLWLGQSPQPRQRRVSEQRLWQARLCELPGKTGLWLALFREQRPVRDLLGRWAGDPARSLAASEQLPLLLARLPEELPEGEHPVLLEWGPFRLAWPLLPRRVRWARPLLDLPVSRSAFAGGEFPWEVNQLECRDVDQARRTFELGFVKPRKDMLQHMLEHSRTVRYEMGLKLVDLGRGHAWYFRGAARGRRQLLYFQNGSRVVWLVARQGGKPAPRVEQLIERLELFEE